MPAMTVPRLFGAAGAVGGAWFAQLKYVDWCASLPVVEPHEGTLFATAAATHRAGSCAICMGVPAHLLLPADAASLPVSRRGNYATIEASLLQHTLDRLVRKLGSELPVDPAPLTDFGAERLLGPEDAPTWVGASVRGPRWVGDDQLVLLCSGRVREAPTFVTVHSERRKLHAAVAAITADLQASRAR